MLYLAEPGSIVIPPPGDRESRKQSIYHLWYKPELVGNHVLLSGISEAQDGSVFLCHTSAIRKCEALSHFCLDGVGKVEIEAEHTYCLGLPLHLSRGRAMKN